MKCKYNWENIMIGVVAGYYGRNLPVPLVTIYDNDVGQSSDSVPPGWLGLLHLWSNLAPYLPSLWFSHQFLSSAVLAPDLQEADAKTRVNIQVMLALKRIKGRAPDQKKKDLFFWGLRYGLRWQRVELRGKEGGWRCLLRKHWYGQQSSS